MPSIVRSTMWFLRIRLPHAVIEEHVKKLIWIDTKRMLCMFHNADQDDPNEHCHIVMELDNNLQKQAFDLRVRKVFPDAVGALYSSKPWDGKDEACSYLFHDVVHKLCYNKGFSDEDIARFKMLNDNVQKVMTVAKQKSECKLTNKLIEWVKETKKPQTLCDIWTQAYKLIRDGDSYHPGEFRLKTMTQTAYARTVDQDSFDLFVRVQYHANFREC